MDSDKLIIENFIKEVCELFPAVAEAIDKRMERLGDGAQDVMYTERMEAFSQSTTNAIKIFDDRTVVAHFDYISNKLKTASKVEANYIDVYYIEPLMWDIKDKNTKKWGWSRLPTNLRGLYRKMWGEPDV